MRTQTAIILAATLISFNAAAVPISYDVTFDGSVAGPSGTGVLVHDSALAANDQITAFSWVFGSVSGSLNTSSALFDAHEFAILSGVSTGSVGHQNISGFTNVLGDFSVTVVCGSTTSGCVGTLGTPGYEFTDVTGLFYRGLVSIAETQVPAPTTLALLAFGLAGIGYGRRKNIKTA